MLIWEIMKIIRFYLDVQVVGTFFVQKLSFRATNTPSRGSDLPVSILFADSSAFLIAKSSVNVVKALNFLLKARILGKSATNSFGQIDFSVNFLLI